MNKKWIKILSIVLIVLQIVLISNISFAVTGTTLAKNFNGLNGVEGAASGVAILEKIIGPILQVVRIIATGISIIMIIYLGIQYMSAAPQEKADIKNKLITFTIGAIVVVSTTKILSMILAFANSTIVAN